MAKRKPAKRALKASTRLKKVAAGRSRAQVVTGKRVGAYASRLKQLRALTDRFDAQKFDKALASRPRTAAGKAARAKALRSVTSTYKRVRLYLAVPHKIVQVRPGKNARRNLEELRKYSGFAKIKGLRGVPVETYHPKKLRVTFDKQNRPTIAHKGGGSHKFFRFPHMPRNGDDLIGFVEQMLNDKILPQGYYVLASRHRFLIGGGSIMTDRDSLLNEVRRFVEQYGTTPYVVKMIYGVKWITRSDQKMLQFQREAIDERKKYKRHRQEAKDARAARAIAAMDKYFKGTQHERVTGAPSAHARGEPWKEKVPLEEMQHTVKLSRARDSRKKLSERARKTGRR